MLNSAFLCKDENPRGRLATHVHTRRRHKKTSSPQHTLYKYKTDFIDKTKENMFYATHTLYKSFLPHGGRLYVLMMMMMMVMMMRMMEW